MKCLILFFLLVLVLSIEAAPKSSSNDRCVDQPDGTILPSPECQFYVMCQGGAENKIRCQPMGTFFDVRRMICYKRPKVLCWDGITSVGPTTVAPSSPEETEAPSEETTESSVEISPETTPEPAIEESTTMDASSEESTTEAVISTTTTAPVDFKAMCKNILVDLLPHPTDCRKYVLCVLGRFSVEQCKDNQVFYPPFRVCTFSNTEEC